MKQLTLTEFELDYETGAFVLDFRPARDFIEGYIPGSYYMCPRFMRSKIRETVISPEETLVFVAPTAIVSEIHTELEKKEYHNINGWLKGGFETWKANGNKIDVVISIEADELMLDMKYDDPQIIDIRPSEEYDAMHLQGAENIPVEALLFNLEDLPKDGVYYLYCEDGELSLSIISCLKSQGLHNYYHIRGGFISLRQNEATMES